MSAGMARIAGIARMRMKMVRIARMTLENDREE